MPQASYVYIGDKHLVCPVCGCNQFTTKNYRVAGEWLQTLDMEGFGKLGVMVICSRCSRIEHFANARLVGIGKPVEP